ncbi:[protein-PII] uridylyltransferase [Dongshaea marina]|uniref:[protein-PII] uridylyltransferase n=1 Tax=Dongshaea marina TaxID=2047966 RepID=UPI000D3EDCDE|nr:[protein-PII] uridylyltransferase [Dongshaea marina]
MPLDPSQLDPFLSAAVDLPQGRLFIENLDNQLSEAFSANTPVAELVHYRAQQFDRLLQALWNQCTAISSQSMALIAVGGYGRQELLPGSDIDLLVLITDTFEPHQSKQISHFLTLLWDLHLDIGHSVRTQDECIEQGKKDITVATSLMESRLIAGAAPMFTELQQVLDSDLFWSSEAFFEAKCEEQKQRHQRYRNTVYLLEPDLKHNPGGLRDLQTIGWIARRHLGSHSVEEMAISGFLSQAEAKELTGCRDSLWRLRFALHLISGKKDNRLLFDHQRSVAQLLGWSGEGNRPVETMMRHFYQVVRRVSELNELLLELFDEHIINRQPITCQPITAQFELRGPQLEIRHPSIFSEDPSSLLALFYTLITQPQAERIGAVTLRELYKVKQKLTAPLCQSEACRRLMLAILRHPKAIEAFELMHHYDLLSSYFPEWKGIVGQMQFDLLHTYTVDEHTIRALTKLRLIASAEGQSNYPLCHQLLQHLYKPELLYLATLFHDIGKGKGGNHSEIGAETAYEFCRLHQLSHKESEIVSWLVRHHLLMSTTAQRRDICDPEVIREFSLQAGDERHLDLLYCLTVADMNATNDKLWNDWKGSLLRQLYFATQRMLRQGPELSMDVRRQIRDRQRRCRLQLQKRGESTALIDKLWQQFKSDYFIRYSDEQVINHTQAILAHQQQGENSPLVSITSDSARGSSELLLYCNNRPNLFASVATLLSQKRLTIHQAQIMTTREEKALDSFVILEPDGSPLSHHRIPKIQQALLHALKRPTSKVRKKERLSRRLQPFRVNTRILFLQTAGSHKHTLMELKTLDIPGLLARVGAVFQECKLQLHSAKITTIGEQAQDLFMLTDRQDRPLDDSLKRQLTEKLLQSLNNDREM